VWCGYALIDFSTNAPAVARYLFTLGEVVLQHAAAEWSASAHETIALVQALLPPTLNAITDSVSAGVRALIRPHHLLIAPDVSWSLDVHPQATAATGAEALPAIPLDPLVRGHAFITLGKVTASTVTHTLYGMLLSAVLTLVVLPSHHG